MNNALPPNKDDDPKWKVWRGLLTASLSIPSARVDRAAFLRSQFKSHFDECIVKKAIEQRPAEAGIPKGKIDELASSCIRWHVVQVSSMSFVTGLPGGWWIVGTIPADLAQFYWHAVVLCQKLAYLRITLFIGVMMGAHGANRVLAELAERFAMEVARRLPREALTKYGIYNLAKQIGRWIGIQITKSSFARAISRVIPIIGGIISASVSAGMMIPMANRLKDHLRNLRFADESETLT